MTLPILRAIVEHGRDELHKDYHVDSCIAGTAIVIDVLQWAGIKARPLATTVNVINKEGVAFIKERGWPTQNDLTEWNSRNCKWLVVGTGGGAPGPAGRLTGTWDGHLVAVANVEQQDYLIDLTLDQGNRLEYGIKLPTILAKTPRDFSDKPGVLELDIYTCKVGYISRPSKIDYTDAPDWQLERRRKRVVRNIIRWAKHDRQAE